MPASEPMLSAAVASRAVKDSRILGDKFQPPNGEYSRDDCKSDDIKTIRPEMRSRI